MNDQRLMPSPRTVTVAVTGRCNLRCRYCFYAGEMEALKDLPGEVWLSFFERLGELGVLSVTLTGGEAFTRADLFSLIDGITDHRMRYSILSNGTLLDDALLERFEEGKRRVRLDTIQVSIDGSTAKVHDANRPRSFDRAIAGLRRLVARKLPASVRVTISQANLEDLEGIAKLLLEDVGVPAISTNEATAIGSGCENRPTLALTSAQQVQAMEALEDLQRRYPGRLKAQAGPQAKRVMFQEMEHAKRTGEAPTRREMGRLTGCGCVFSRIDILHDGTIVPCHMLHALALGNIRQDSLTDVWQHHPILRAMRERRAISMLDVEGCGNCEWAPFCNGSCPAPAFEVFGRLDRANPHDCYRRFLSELEGGSGS